MSTRSKGRRVALSPPPLRYFFEDPIRLLTIACALFLMFAPVVPVWLLVMTVAVSQFNGLGMAARMLARGGSRGGEELRRTWLVQHLGTESFALSSCTLLGGLLLLRVFGRPEPVLALGALTIAVAMVPDIRVCRWTLPRDVRRADRLLREGSFLRDPVKLGTILSAAVFCVLDPQSVGFVLVSLALLQFNSFMVLVDKYAGAVRWRAGGGFSPLTRDAWRVLFSILPLAILPARALGGDRAGLAAGALIVGLVILPDVLRLLALVGYAVGMGSALAGRRARRAIAGGIGELGRMGTIAVRKLAHAARFCLGVAAGTSPDGVAAR